MLLRRVAFKGVVFMAEDSQDSNLIVSFSHSQSIREKISNESESECCTLTKQKIFLHFPFSDNIYSKANRHCSCCLLGELNFNFFRDGLK